MSKADVLKALAGEMAIKPIDLEKIKQQAYDEGYEAGVNGAIETFAITYPCSRCGGEMMVDREEEKQVIRQYLIQYGWGHRNCQRKKL